MADEGNPIEGWPEEIAPGEELMPKLARDPKTEEDAAEASRFSGPIQEAYEFARFELPFEVKLERPFDPNLGSVADEDKQETGHAMVGELMQAMTDLTAVIKAWAEEHEYTAEVIQNHAMAEIWSKGDRGEESRFGAQVGHEFVDEAQTPGSRAADQLIDLLREAGAGPMPPEALMELLRAARFKGRRFGR